jgi:SCP-2 sterol transfer family
MGSKAKAAKQLTSGRGSRSAEKLTKTELKQILDTVLREIDQDPEDGPRLSAAAAPLRIEFTDLQLVLNLSRADRGSHCLEWNFSARSKAKPKLRLSMESAVANRVFQGKENPAIAIARGRLRTRVEDAGAALRFFPAAKPLFSRYRELISQEYPHLALD